MGFKGTIDKQIEWFENRYKKQFVNSQNEHMYELFKKLEPRLRKLQQEKQSQKAYGDNLSKLMESHRVEYDKKAGYNKW